MAPGNDFHDSVHFSGINRPINSSTPPVFPVSSNVYGHCDGKFGLDHSNLVEFIPTHPDVLFSL